MANMFGSKRPSTAPSLRLPKLSTSPGLEDFHYALSQAQKNRGRTIEMPWISADRSSTYVLTVRCDSAGGEPAWLLYRGDGPGSVMAFSYASSDVTLVHSLVINECITNPTHDQTQTATYMSIRTSASPATSGTLTSVGVDSGTFPALAARSKATLEGDLKNMQVPNLLQSIAISKMTGKLYVHSPNGDAQIFFEDGSPLHAITRETTGDLALIELLLWEEGEFLFFPEERSTDRSVNKRLDALLMEGITLVDQNQFLTKAHLTQDSYILRKSQSLTEVEFERLVSQGAPIDIAVQKQFYQAIDNKSTLFEVLRRRPMNKTEWIPVMFNLLTCDLISLTDRSPIAAKPAPLEAMGIDRSAIQGVLKNLSRSETGLFTYPTFLYFLEQEYFRYEAFGYPFSVIIFEPRRHGHSPDSPSEPLSITAVRELARRVSSIKRNIDVLGHYETFDYGLLLPNTSLAAAAVCANRLAELVLRTPLTVDLNVGSIALAVGVASIPEDCHDLGMLLAAAIEAKNRAKKGTSPVVLFRDVAHSHSVA
ncbi:MAG: DUF4388 domain-containing protein [Candidatus Melainabacteria bacterium]|nr:DUF4388 domain-containing protein [Candidatus Melainabacteria bacterium]